jgi:hypothetical protein
MKILRYLEGDGAWLFEPPAGLSFEILIGGTAGEPEPQRILIIRTAVDGIEELTQAAVRHLDAFVDRQKFAKNSNWSVEGLRSVASSETERDVTLQLALDEDVYGFWTVQFNYDGTRFWPALFARRVH